jgi:hypothetical protein
VVSKLSQSAYNQTAELTADKVTAKQICLDDLCIDRAQLKAILDMLHSSGGSATSAPTPSLAGKSAPDAQSDISEVQGLAPSTATPAE